MKRLLRFFMLAVLFLPLAANAQLIATYLFSTGVDNTQWYLLTADSTVLKVGSNNDSYASPVTDLGFTFHFAGEDYTQFSVNSDGTVRLGSTAVTTSYHNSPFGGTYGNFNNPKICGLGCDGYLVGATETSPADYIAYQLFGSEGTHVLVIEISTGTYNTDTRGNHYTFQIQLAELNNSVTLMYSPTAPAAGPAVTYQIGACTSANDIVLFNVANSTMSVFSSGTTECNAAGTWPDAGRYYTLTPNPDPCFPVTALAATNITDTSVTLTWADTSNPYASYNIYNGETGIASLVNDTTYTINGLSANTQYVFSVVSSCAIDNTSNAASITVHTACSSISLPWSCSFEESEIMSTSQATALPWCSQRYVSAGTLGYLYPYSYNNSTYAHSGNRSLYFFGATGANYPDTTAIILPEVDVTTYTMGNNRLTFWARMAAASNSKNVYVGTLTDPDDFSTFTLLETVTVNGNTQTMFSVPLTNATGAYIAMVVFKGAGNLYIDDVTIEEVPTCMEVSNLTVTATTSSSVTLSWDDLQNPAGTAYTVYNMADTSNTLATITGHVAVVGNLTPNTLYTFGVQANCASGDASFITTGARTDCEPFANPHTWTFEGMLTDVTPSCWTKVGEGSVKVMSNANNSHSGSLYVRFSGSTSNLIALPETQNEIVTLQLRFWTRPESYSNTNCGTFSVGYLTDVADASTFVEAAHFVYSDFSAYEEQIVTFAGAPAGARMAMRHNAGSNSWYWYIDDVTIEEAPACLPVSGLTASDITYNSAALTWGGDAASYNIYNMSDTSLVTTVGTTSYNLAGLTANTSYCFGISANCDSDVSTIATVNFTTECAAVALPYTETFEATSNTLDCWKVEGNGNWTFGVGDYSTSTGSFQGDQNAKITHTTTGNVTRFVSPAFEGAQAGMVLDFAYVMRKWGNSNDELRIYTRADANSAWQLAAEYTEAAPAWTTESLLIPGTIHQVAFEYTDNYGYGVGIDSVVFTALPNDYCFAVTNLAASNITSNSVTLSWNDGNNGGATYTIYDMADGSPVATGIADTTFDVTLLTGMPFCTLGVAANCTPVNESDIVTIDVIFADTLHVTLTINDTAMGTITPAVGTYDLIWGDSLLLTAMPNAGADFDGWKISVGDQTLFTLPMNPFPLIVNANLLSLDHITVTAMFSDSTSVPDSLTLILNTADAAMGTTDPAPGAHSYAVGEQYTLTALPNPGYEFLYWVESVTIAGMTMSDTLYPPTVSMVVSPLYAGATLNLTAHFQPSQVEPCATPTGVSVSAFDDQSISLVWNNDANVNSWNIQYRPVGGTLASATSATNSYTITGLAPETEYQIQVQADCGDGNVSDWSAAVTATTTTGIENWLMNSISLYPNPAKEYIDVRVDELHVTGMEVYDVYGKLINTVSVVDNPTRINVSGLASGMYFVRVTTEQGVVTKSFVKK